MPKDDTLVSAIQIASSIVDEVPIAEQPTHDLPVPLAMANHQDYMIMRDGVSKYGATEQTHQALDDLASVQGNHFEKVP